MAFNFEAHSLQLPTSSAATRGNEDSILEEEDVHLEKQGHAMAQDLTDIFEIMHEHLRAQFDAEGSIIDQN